MNLDMDLGRDDHAAFGPQSLSHGAILPYEGRTFLTSPDGVPAAVFEADEDGWIAPSVLLLVRGAARVLPLAWRGGREGSGVSEDEIDAFSSQMQAAGMYWAGNWQVMDLAVRRRDSIGSYLEALHRAGATKVDCWVYSESTGVALVWAGTDEEATRSLSLHVIPVAWVSERHAKKPVPGIDVQWSWHDVVELYAARADSP